MAAIRGFLFCPVPGLSLNALRIHHWIWKGHIRQSAPLDIPQIMDILVQIPKPEVRHAIRIAAVLRTFTSLSSDDCPLAQCITNVLVELLAEFPCANLVISVS